MPTYNITLKEIEIYLVEGIEAESEHEAFEKSLSMIETEEGKRTYYNDSDGDYDAEEI